MIGSCDMTPVLEQRFFAKVRKTDSCWEWVGCKNGSGYGMIKWQRKPRYAHRISYEMAKGEIPIGLVIDHLCRNPGCCNPEHLEAVTPRENVMRGDARHNGAEQRRKTHCPQGHEYTEDNTYRYRSNRHCRECGRMNNRRARVAVAKGRINANW